MVVLIDCEAFQYKSSPYIIKELSIYNTDTGIIYTTILPPPANIELDPRTLNHFNWLTHNIHGLKFNDRPTGSTPYYKKLRYMANLMKSSKRIYTKGLDKARRLSTLLGMNVKNLENIATSTLSSIPSMLCCPHNHLFHYKCSVLRCELHAMNYFSKSDVPEIVFIE